ncbi:MAG: hypothetical protein IJ805_08305 [Lachnospiraceae bacterium]|nr:hypothetical protein [Lachnospiraceae bacterium]
MPTVKLYDEMPYERNFRASVLGISDAGDGGCIVELDRTLFFPEEGGQSSDIGFLGGYEVTHAAIKNDLILHYIKCGPSDLIVGDEIEGSINWEHRFSNMQNHTGEHILSGLLHSRWDSENAGFHLSDNIVTLDTSRELDENITDELEAAANRVIYENIPVSCRYFQKNELEGIEYRSKKEFDSDIRLVTIPGVDVCACCAPHVARTGEIGIITIIRSMRYKGGTRLTFLCGKRAYEYLLQVKKTADNIAHMLSENTGNLTGAVERILNERDELEVKLKNAARRRLYDDIDRLSDDIKEAVLFTDKADNLVQRDAVNYLAERHSGICAVFSSDNDGGYNYICAYPEGDARSVSKLLRDKLTAKGGGSKEMVQGNVKASEEEIRQVLLKNTD